MKFRTVIVACVLLTLWSPVRAQWMQMSAPLDSAYVGGLIASGTDLFVVGGAPNGQFGTIGFVFRSTDRGSSWKEIDSGMTGFLTSFVADGANLFAARYNIAGADSSGFFLSTNSGTSWQLTSASSALKASYVGLFESGGKLLARTTDTGISRIFLSTDTANSWIFASSLTSTEVISFAAIDTMFFVSTAKNGVYRSTDNGISWRAINNGFPFDTIHNDYPACNTIVLLGTTMFAGTQNGIFFTTDNGMSWAPANSGLPAKTSVTCFAESGTNIFAGTGRGIFLSTNGGTNWTAMNEGLSVINVNSLLVYDTMLFATTGYPYAAPSGVWRRPLSEFGVVSAVREKRQDMLSLSIYPNPTTASTTISVRPEASGYAEISVVNLLGQEVARVYSGVLDASEHTFTWGGPCPDPSRKREGRINSGVYECVVRMNGRVQTVSIVIQ